MNNTISNHLNLQPSFPKSEPSQIHTQKMPTILSIVPGNEDSVRVSISQEGLAQYHSSISSALTSKTSAPFVTETIEFAEIVVPPFDVITIEEPSTCLIRL